MQHFSKLIDKKNLLAFSAGVDSSALFFLLIEADIPFDIAFVNYGTRDQSLDEESYALELAKRYNIEVYITKAPRYETHFEANARAFRYDYFESLIETYSYDNLITAHQLNDQLEWLLMRLSRGAGLCELIGLEPHTERKTAKGASYKLIRPLLDKTKQELLIYLQSNNHKYFIDQSNKDKKYERNRFREAFSDPLLEQFTDGIKRSFNYLYRDKLELEDGIELLLSHYELRVYTLNKNSLKTRATDLALKELGYLLSANQRQEIERKDSIVIGGKWAVVYQSKRLYICPFINSSMPKKYKELCRISSMPIKIRAYCYSKDMRPLDVMGL